MGNQCEHLQTVVRDGHIYCADCGADVIGTGIPGGKERHGRAVETCPKCGPACNERQISKLTQRESWLCSCLTLCNGTHLNCRDCGKDRPENMIVVAHLRRIDGGLQPVYGVAGVMRDVPRFLTALMPGNKEGNG